MIRTAVLLSLLIGGGLPVAQAQMIPTPLPGDSRLVQFEYDSDQTFLVLSKPKAVTHLEFGADERIVTVAGGDTKNWEITPTSNKRHIFLKPHFDNLETSMTVLTDKRSYQFVLRSTSAGAKWYQRVTWQYGNTVLVDDISTVVANQGAATGLPPAIAEQGALQRGEMVDPNSLNFGYVITGEAAFRPDVVFSDGRFTRIKLPRGLQELPALFSVGEDGEPQLVNYVVKANELLVQQVIESGILRLGRSTVTFSSVNRPRKAQAGFVRGDGG